MLPSARGHEDLGSVFLFHHVGKSFAGVLAEGFGPSLNLT